MTRDLQLPDTLKHAHIISWLHYYSLTNDQDEHICCYRMSISAHVDTPVFMHQLGKFHGDVS